MTIKANGAEKLLPDGMTLSAFLTQEGYQQNRIAVERNGEIVPKSRYEQLLLADGDALEVVSFVGGG